MECGRRAGVTAAARYSKCHILVVPVEKKKLPILNKAWTNSFLKNSHWIGGRMGLMDHSGRRGYLSTISGDVGIENVSES